MSPRSPFSVVVDRTWGPQTERAFHFVADNYNLTSEKPSGDLLDVLSIISDRLIGLRCDGVGLIESLPHSPFMVINDNEENIFELIQEGTIARISNGAELIRFKDLITKKHILIPGVNAVGAWLMLLQMGRGDDEIKKYELMVKPEQGDWISIDDIGKSNDENDYAGKKLRHLDFTRDWPNLPVRFRKGDDINIDIIGVCLSGHLRFTTVTGYRNAPVKDGVTEVFFDFEGFYNYQDKSQSDFPEVIAENPDLFKIFVIKNSEKKLIKEDSYKNPPGLESIRPDFYKLISLEPPNILATVTFELGLAGKKPDFKVKVQKLYKQKDITVSDDLQKGRWGGLSEKNGVSIKSSVTRSKIPGLYKVVLTVSSTSKSPLGDEVAFFLHDSFREEIKYEPVVKGKAQIELTAYEAFTVGVYTEDGTELELDLNDVPNYPIGFYYNEVDEKFRQKIEEVYKLSTKVVEDDLQKNRWGGKPIAGGKEISAEVVKALTPGFYRVTITVHSEKPDKPLTGDVAIFLHDSFRDPIRYKRAVEGKAKITVNAFEAFTVGAYTEDGTRLELDLQQVKGFPEGFYYKGSV